MTDTNRAEADAIAELAIRSVDPHILDPSELYSVVVPVGYDTRIVNLEQHRAVPDRHRGLTCLHDADSFINFVSTMETTESRIYANVDDHRLVAVLNDASKDTPAWGDHAADLTLRFTPEWKHWAGQDGEMMSQEAFAEHIEEGLLEIKVPDGATMLELAQTFHANTGVAFKSSQILASGERKLVYEESTVASAGAKGEITVPKEFELGIMPFEGSVPYKVIARLRHRASGGSLKLGYRLTRPHDVIQSAFDDTVTKVDEATAATTVYGVAPRGI